MEAHEAIANGYGHVLRALEYTLDGLTPEDLNWQPKPDSNSIGWLVWHLTRWHDFQISRFMEEEQVWIKGGWYRKFGRPADPRDHGLGHKPADLAGFKSPDAATLLGYHRAVLERSRHYFPTLSQNDLDRIIEGTPFKPPPTLGMALMGTLSDGLQHAGQASYLRGLRQGMGWH
ncbi:MAG: DinB family protein [Chloroflexota bacterium]